MSSLRKKIVRTKKVEAAEGDNEDFSKAGRDDDDGIENEEEDETGDEQSEGEIDDNKYADDENEVKYIRVRKVDGEKKTIAVKSLRRSPDAEDEDDNAVLLNQSNIPVMVKNNVWKKSVLICEFDDPDLSFVGDSGAIGRISATASSLNLDLKGRQYAGCIVPGPTVMLLNLAQPVGQQQPQRQIARAEVISNEFCRLEFEKDLLAGMMGQYSGGLFDSGDESDRGASGTGGAPQKQKFGGSTLSDSEEDESIVSSRSDGSRNKKEIKKKKNPKISTITNRKRKDTKKRKSSQKKEKRVKKR